MTKKIPTDPIDRREWIKSKVLWGGLTRLAKQHKKHPQAFSRALVAPNEEIERIIAKELGCEPWELFPERWRGQTHMQQLRFRASVSNLAQ